MDRMGPFYLLFYTVNIGIMLNNDGCNNEHGLKNLMCKIDI